MLEWEKITEAPTLSASKKATCSMHTQPTFSTWAVLRTLHLQPILSSWFVLRTLHTEPILFSWSVLRTPWTHSLSSPHKLFWELFAHSLSSPHGLFSECFPWSNHFYCLHVSAEEFELSWAILPFKHICLQSCCD